MAKSKLKITLEEAGVVCRPCGLEYGRNTENDLKHRELGVTVHQAQCDICKRETSVSGFRNYGYERELRPGETFKKELAHE